MEYGKGKFKKNYSPFCKRKLNQTESNPNACFNREYDITKERIEKILAAGANVILTTGGIDDLCLKYFVEAGAMAVRRCKKVDLKRIAKATGGRTISYKSGKIEIVAYDIFKIMIIVLNH